MIVMADEGKVDIGAAYVAIIPSARGFARELRKDIAKEFSGSNLDKMVADALTGHQFTVPVQVPVGADTDRLRAEIADAVGQVEATLTADVPTAPGDRQGYERRLRDQVEDVASGVRAHVAVDVDVDEPLRSGRLHDTGETVGRSLAGSVASSFGSSLSALSGPAAFAGLVAAAVIAGPLIGAAIAGGVLAVLGGGVIGLGIAALSQDPLFQRAASGLSSTIQGVLAKAAAPLLGTEDNPGPLLQAMEVLADLAVELGPSLQEMFAAIGPYIPTLAEGVAEFIRAVMPAVVEGVKASGPILEAFANNMGPLGESFAVFLNLIVESMPAAVQAINVIAEVIGFTMRAAGVLVFVLSATFSSIYSLVTWVMDAARGAWETVSKIFTTGGATVKERVEAFVGAVIKLFHGLPGRITDALGNLGGLLYRAGRNVVQGLINGIRDMFGSLRGAASSMAQVIRDHLPFSPARTGPLSGSGNPYYSGRSIVDLLASGVTSNLSTAERAAADLAGAFTGQEGGVLSLAGAAPPDPAGLRIEWTGGDGDPIVRAIRDHTRIYYGGSAQAALGG